MANIFLAAVVFVLAFFAPHETPRPTTLKAASFQEAARVPFELEVPIAREQIFKPLLKCQQPLVDLLGSFTITRRKKDLLVEGEDLVRPLKARAGRKPVVLELPVGERKVPVLFYVKQGEWFAAPAAMLRGKTAVGVLELLDVDLDGSFDGPLDFLAWRGGRLHLQNKQPRIYSEGGLHTFTLTQVKRKTLLDLSAPEFPEGVYPAVKAAWLLTNELRNGVGLEPVQLNLKRAAATAAHAHYLQINGSGGAGNLNVHEEVPGAPGYTPQGRKAASGNVSWHSFSNDLAKQPLYEFGTLFHRAEFVFPSLTMGAGSEGEYGVVWVENAQNDTARWLQETGMESSWVMVPGPGATEVPKRARRDSPVPASVPTFYSRDRGYPVSVACSYSYSQLQDVSLRLFDEDGEEVEGFLITMSDAGFTSQSFSADYLFAAKERLESLVEYRAEYRARLISEDRQLSFSWTFITGK